MKTTLHSLVVLLITSFQLTHAQCSRSGSFIQSDPAYSISGTGNITFTTGGDKNVIFESDFATVQGADLRVYLSKTDDIANSGADEIEVTTTQLMNDGGGTGGPGVSPITGMMSFPIPGYVELDDYNYIVIQCITINERWGHVTLGANSGGDCATLSLENELFEKQLSIYPNPLKNNLYVNSDLTENIDIKIYTILGEILFEEKTNNATIINTETFKTGIYFVELSSGNKKITKKLIKN
jgi:hypothetical protein